MTRIILTSTLLCVALSGCASLNFAGNASYSVKPVQVGLAIVCCEVTIADGKERAALDVHVNKAGENYDITFSERSVTAFAGQAIAANATQEAISAAAKAAVVAILGPVLPAVIGAGGAGAVIGGAATGGIATQLLTPVAPVVTPVAPAK